MISIIIMLSLRNININNENNYLNINIFCYIKIFEKLIII